MLIAFSCICILLLGGAIGVISNALGIGGGFIMLPLMIAFVPDLGMEHYNTVKGTDLMCILFIASLNAWRLNKGREDKNLKLAGVIASGSVIGAFTSSKISHNVDPSILAWIFICVMTLLAVRTIISKPRYVSADEVHKNNVLAFLIGLFAGVLSGFTAIGGGAAIVPLVLLAGVVTNERVVALSNTVMIATTMAATIANLTAERTFDVLPGTIGQVNLLIVPLVVIGAQFGVPIGRRLNVSLTLVRRKMIMGVLLLIVTIGMMHGAVTQGSSEETAPEDQNETQESTVSTTNP